MHRRPAENCQSKHACCCQDVLGYSDSGVLSCQWNVLRVSVPALICRAAIRLGVFAYLLFLLSSGVDGYFEGQALPDQLTARNITITLRTVVRGLSYLMTFLFAANTVGLTGETWIRPEVSQSPIAWYRHLSICHPVLTKWQLSGLVQLA